MKTDIKKNKPLGLILILISLFGFALIVYRLASYNFEYDAQYYPVDYGRYNFLFYFTVQSNILGYLYFLFAGLAMLGVKKAEKIGFNGTFGTLVTLYVVIAGAVYCGGLPFGFAPPFTFDTVAHRMTVVMQIFYHMFMPVAVIALYLFPVNKEKQGRKTILISAIYPIAYSVFSMIRGRIMVPSYYPYPFYNPEFVWTTLMKDKPINLFVSYAIISLAILILGGGLFMGICAIFVSIHNKRTEKNR